MLEFPCWNSKADYHPRLAKAKWPISKGKIVSGDNIFTFLISQPFFCPLLPVRCTTNAVSMLQLSFGVYKMGCFPCDANVANVS